MQVRQGHFRRGRRHRARRVADSSSGAHTAAPVENDLTITTVAAPIAVGATSFARTSNLAANPAAGAVAISCVSTTDVTTLAVAKSYTTTVAGTTALTGGTSTLDTLVAGVTATSNALALGITTELAVGNMITCRYDMAIFAAAAAITVDGVASGAHTAAATSDRILVITTVGGPRSPPA